MKETNQDRARDAEKRLENSDVPVVLRRTLIRKIESGEDEGLPIEDFARTLHRASQPEQSDPETSET